MKELATDALRKVGYLVAAYVVITSVAALLRPVLYPNGLPGPTVLLVIVALVGGSFYWLYRAFWPLMQEIERRFILRALERFSND